MNGVHDMGGMHGYGPVHHGGAEPPFHAAWERRAYTMVQVLMRLRVFNVDELRRAIESIPPAQYLSSTYYQRWLAALLILMEEKGVVTASAVDAAVGQFAREPERLQRMARRDNPSLVQAMMAHRHPASPLNESSPARYQLGDRVVTRNQHVKGHTRLPRYVRGKQGVIHRFHGVYTLPDTNAHGLGKHPQPVYSVRFAARDLWGDAAAARDNLYIDLWES
ncbi:MAG: nitrile hydratase subunit beta, partial [bacterium]